MNLRNILLATMLAGVGAFSGMAFAQDTGSDTAGSGGAGGRAERANRLNFLSTADRQHFLRVRREAMEAHPELKSEQENLRKEWQALKAQGSNAPAGDRETFRHDLRAHNEQMDAAMLKIDPSIQPILDQIKAHRQERLQQAGAASGGDDSGNP